jgi:hypothetical protein
MDIEHRRCRDRPAPNDFSNQLLAKPRMSRRRKHRHRSKRSPLNPREIVLVVGICFGMLLLALFVIVPLATKRNFSSLTAFCLAILVWACGIFAFWACLRSRRRHSHSHDRHATTHNDDSDFDD